MPGSGTSIHHPHTTTNLLDVQRNVGQRRILDDDRLGHLPWLRIQARGGSCRNLLQLDQGLRSGGGGRLGRPHSALLLTKITETD